MTGLYLAAGISKQGHFQALRHLESERTKEPCYLGLMLEARAMHPGMGLRTMYEQFEPAGIGRDAFVELGLRAGFRLRAPQNPRLTTRAVPHLAYPNLLEGRRFTDVNQLWSSDIFYFPFEGRHYYGVLIMDVYSRRLIGWSMADNLRAENNLAALHQALTLRGVADYGGTLIHHSDRGSQYVSDAYTETLKSHGIRISMCQDVLENAHIERANGTVKNDYLERWEIRNQPHLFERMDMAGNNYNNRMHRSIGMTPIQHETYIKELPQSQRPEITVFTLKRNVDNPLQLQLPI